MTSDIQLQSILLPDKDICGVQELYYHKQGKKTTFDGYFNLFYIEKRKTYTAIESVTLSLQLRGYQKVLLYHDQSFLYEMELAAEQLKQYVLELPYTEYKTGVFWFELEQDESCREPMVSGFFTGKIAETRLREVNIGIDICTYHRETYVERNLIALHQRLLERSELDVHDQVWIYIVDNGNSLDQHQGIRKLETASEGRIRIFPNKNSGGAGGFTRGMLETLKNKERLSLTHVLLMDDDAVIEPDTIVRIYGLLATLKDEWQDITVGGAMMREDYPYILFCAGESWEQGRIINPLMNLDVRDFAKASCDYLTETGHEYDRYSGWWCCCYSLNTVRRDNLPLPLFIHHDDIEFGLRNQRQGIVFLNGVGVWHRAAELNFPGANLYYDVRNNLLEIALHQSQRQRQTARIIAFKAFISSVIRLKYPDAVLVQQGILDFLRGPKWLYEQDPDQLNARIRALALRLYPLEELKSQLSESEYCSVMEQIRDFQAHWELDTILESRRQKRRKAWLHWLTLNGWLLPADRQAVKVVCSTDAPYAAFRKRKVVLYEVSSGRVALLQRKYKELGKTMVLAVKTLLILEHGFNAAARSYRKNAARISSEKAWKAYLERS